MVYIGIFQVLKNLGLKYVDSIRRRDIRMNQKYGHLFIVREWGKDLGFNLEIEKCLREYHGDENVEVIIIPNDANIFQFFVNLIFHKMPKKCNFKK